MNEPNQLMSTSALSTIVALSPITTSEDIETAGHQLTRPPISPVIVAQAPQEPAIGHVHLSKSGSPVPASTSPHDYLCRTVSDTLGAEFNEYVTVIKTTPYGQQPGSASPSINDATVALDALFDDCHYNSKVEFGLKLGYTEEQVQLALVKLGPSAGQNELLAELIKLGAASGKDNGSDSSDYGDEPTATGPADPRHYALSARNSTQGADDSCNLRPIVIDGSNVAMSHGNKEVFSCLGIKIAVDWFRARGHTQITVIVPMWRKEHPRPDAPTKDQHILQQLETERVLTFTPSRNAGGRRIVCYDDRYILNIAAENDGIVVSNDNYRDLCQEKPEFKKVVEERLLMYSFVNDRFMPPEDPLGRHGPSLANFLRKKSKPCESTAQQCPYGKKCTYGNKCKYFHPERGNQQQKSVSEKLAEKAKIQLQEMKARQANNSRESSPAEKLKVHHTGSLPPNLYQGSELKRNSIKKNALSRTKSVTPGQTIGAGSGVGSASSHSILSVASSHSDSPLLDCPGQPGQQYWMLGHHQQPPPAHHSLAPGPRHQLHPLHHPHLPHQQPLFQSNSCAELYTPHQAEHMFVCSTLSDPENQDRQRSNYPATHTHSLRSNPGGPGGPPADGGHNLHRKLQRQLTLNPTCDPRLQQMARYQSQQHPSAPTGSIGGLPSPGPEDSRAKLYYHLSSLFPKEQVQTVMDMYPHETKAPKLCEAILAMFPNRGSP